MPLLQEKSPCCRVAAGHEPMHCGYIGQGMLSGPVREIFTSPTPDKIFECSMQIDGGEGVPLIIKITPAIFLTLKQRPSYRTIAA